MARLPPDDASRTIACPHCGEAIAQRAPVCRHCGSDRATGLREDEDDGADVELPEAMSDSEYDEFVANEARGRMRVLPGDGVSDAVLRRRRRVLFAIVLALLYLLGRYGLALF